MEKKSILLIPIIYLIFITGINICFLLWANIESYKYNITIIEEQENVSKENSSNNQTNDLSNNINKSFDESLKLAEPILDAGMRAEEALPIFAYGVFAGLFVSIFTFLPSWIKKYIDQFIKDNCYEDMNWNLIKIYELGILLINVVVTFFQFLGATGFVDFGAAIVNGG